MRGTRDASIGAMKFGLMLPIGEEEPLGRPPSFEHLKAMTIAAEEGGLDSVWCADHVLFRPKDGDHTKGIHEAWTLLSAMAALTSRIELGPLVLCVPFRNPAMIAKMAATFDEVSAGRLVLGLGCGWHEPETLELTAGVFVQVAADDGAPENAMRGSPAEIADALAGYAELGISHLIVHLWPRTPEAVATLAEAAALARDRLPGGGG